ncbi:hypothetical protein D9M72_606910 [compost metagenome]
MLDHLGDNDPVYAQASATVISAIETVLSEGPRTRDMGGTANTVDVGRAIAECIASA